MTSDSGRADAFTCALTWVNGLPPFQVEVRTNLLLGDWLEVGGPTVNQSQSVPATADAVFSEFRVQAYHRELPLALLALNGDKRNAAMRRAWRIQ